MIVYLNLAGKSQLLIFIFYFIYFNTIVEKSPVCDRTRSHFSNDTVFLLLRASFCKGHTCDVCIFLYISNEFRNIDTVH